MVSHAPSPTRRRAISPENIPMRARLCSVLAFALASRLGWATWSAVSALRALEAQQLRFSNMRDDI